MEKFIKCLIFNVPALEFRTYYFDCATSEQCSIASFSPAAATYSSANRTLFNITITTAAPFVDALNFSRNATGIIGVCKPEVAILYLLLLACTYWICISMLNFTKT